jgi:D-amino-acid dehydrogenase
MRSATKRNLETAARPLKDIAVFSQNEYAQWATMEGFDFAYEKKGMLEIFKTEKVGEHAVHTVETGKKLGLDVELVDAKGLQQLEPQATLHALGAIYFKCDAHLYPNKLMSTLKDYLQQQGTVMIQDEVTGFEKSGNKVQQVLTKSQQNYVADEVIVATGSWSRGIASMLQTKIPLMPGRGYSFTLDQPKDRLRHPAILAEGRVAITPFEQGNKMRYGGTMEVVSTNTPPRYHRVAGIVAAVKDFLPGFSIEMPSQENIWYGFRPTSADGLPYIGRISKYKNVIVATGHSMLGLSLGAGTGRLVSELVNEEKPGIDMKAFSVERFN